MTAVILYAAGVSTLNCIFLCVLIGTLKDRSKALEKQSRQQERQEKLLRTLGDLLIALYPGHGVADEQARKLQVIDFQTRLREFRG